MNKWKYKILIQSLQDSCNAWAFEGEETLEDICTEVLTGFLIWGGEANNYWQEDEDGNYEVAKPLQPEKLREILEENFKYQNVRFKTWQFEEITNKKIVFENTYSDESLCNLERDVYEAFDEKFNPIIGTIPKMDPPCDDFMRGEFKVTIKWSDE